MNNKLQTMTSLIPSNAVEILPDTDRFKYRYSIKSASSDKLYRISYDNAPGAGYWTCSCPGNIRHGSCKHLEAAGLKGRKYGRTALPDRKQIEAPRLALTHAA
jgi:hypothetical protein